ncbi:hypothetical protein GCM10007049_21070 [Echinicola pacifica]|uniref:Uncharacterized protein n=1 Tax=Echinicola pacifica TaxID=346377 RepID=A0A918Q1D1_9BACT|nr:hypothetical protein [Echinicola pacifica]GGZ27961.1 hypothetical protein GCM10007049_21070 [Echinicola pacifica]
MKPLINFKSIYLSIWGVIVSATQAFGQLPKGTPMVEDSGINTNDSAEVIIYIVLPLVVLVLGLAWYFFYKKPQKDKIKKEAQNQRR